MCARVSPSLGKELQQGVFSNMVDNGICDVTNLTS